MNRVPHYKVVEYSMTYRKKNSGYIASSFSIVFASELQQVQILLVA